MRSGSPPEFFIDRSLGCHIVPDALRAAGATVHTMADIYGERMGQGLSDEEWLRDAGRQGWVVLMKDAKVRHRPAQRLAIETYAVDERGAAKLDRDAYAWDWQLVARSPSLRRKRAACFPRIAGRA